MPDTPSPVAMRLAKELHSLGLVDRWDSVARALDSAGIAEAVEKLKSIIRINAMDKEAGMRTLDPLSLRLTREALSALTGDAAEVKEEHPEEGFGFHHD